jgi:REP element-mobilizing transposase RayT
MPQSLSRVLIHLTFSTHDRHPYLSPEIRPELFSYLAGSLREHDSTPLKVGGVADHVHLLFGISRIDSIAGVVEYLKTASSKWIKPRGPEFSTFHWQRGYGAFSVGMSEIDTIRGYIDRQEDHHRRVTFQEEYLAFLHRYGIDYDERYVWD